LREIEMRAKNDLGTPSLDIAFTEDEVVAIVCEWLEANRCTIVGRCSTSQHGIDIVAESHTGPGWRIEAKGGRSGREGSNRFGKNFTPSQTIDRVMKGFFTAAAMAEARDRNGARIGLAIPRSAIAETYTHKVRASMNTLGITLLWIEPDGTVTLIEPTT
jgi:hypothetical protein